MNIFRRMYNKVPEKDRGSMIAACTMVTLLLLAASYVVPLYLAPAPTPTDYTITDLYTPEEIPATDPPKLEKSVDKQNTIEPQNKIVFAPRTLNDVQTKDDDTGILYWIFDFVRNVFGSVALLVLLFFGGWLVTEKLRKMYYEARGCVYVKPKW